MDDDNTKKKKEMDAAAMAELEEERSLVTEELNYDVRDPNGPEMTRWRCLARCVNASMERIARRESRGSRRAAPPPRNLSDHIVFVEPNCDGIEMVLDVQPRDVHLQNRGKLGCWVVNSNEKRGGGSGF